MNYIVTIQARQIARVCPVGNGIEIGAVMTEDQLVAAFVSYIENSGINDAQAAALVERIQGELTA